MTHGPVGDSGSGLDYEESEHSGRVVRIASVAALGGLLFGYDSAVINGAVSAIQEHFEIEQRSLPASPSRRHCSAAAVGRADRRTARRQDRPALGDEDRRGAVPHQCDRHGPRCQRVADRGLFRVVGGIGVGVASVIAPAYIAETSPPRIRGRLGSLQQLAIVSGIFLSLAIDCAAGASRRRSRRGAVAGHGGLAVDVPRDGFARHPLRRLAFTIPESPRYLVAHIPDSRSPQSAQHAARREEPRDHDHADPGVAEARETSRHGADLRKPTGGLYGIVWVGVGLSIFQQFVGINVIFYYSQRAVAGGRIR